MIEPFSVVFDRSTGVLVVRGELDQATARHLDALDLDGHVLRRIDCTGTSFISAAGVAALLACCGSTPTMVTASPVVRRLIELCELDDVLLLDDAIPTTN